MKKLVMVAGVLVCLSITLTSRGVYRTTAAAKLPAKKNCFGYTIVEAGKGIDCNGDTIRLKKNYQMVKRVSR